MVTSVGILSVSLALLVVFIRATQGEIDIVQPDGDSVTISEGSDVTLECRYPSTESVEWSINGMTIQNSTHDPQRFRIHAESDDDDDEDDHDDDDDADDDHDDDRLISVLTVKGVTLAEHGEYKCSNADIEKAVFDKETETDSVDVKVVRQMIVVIKIEGPEKGVVVDGDDLWLTCTGDRNSDLSWYLNNNILKEDQEGITITNELKVEGDEGHRKSVLTVNEVSTEHQGQYRCVDKVNNAEASIDIRVREGGVINIIQPQGESITVSEGSEVTLECRYPSTESVQWSINGMPIQNTTHDPQRFRIHAESDDDDDEDDHDDDDDDADDDHDDDRLISVLTVKGVTLAEHGEYKCSNADIEKAMDEPERETDSVDVKVIRQRVVVVEIKGPLFGYAITGEDLWLTCTGDGNSDLSWYLNNNILKEDQEGITITNELKVEGDEGHRKSVLTVNDVKLEHEGQYRCVDKVHNAEASIDIPVKQGLEKYRIGESASSGFTFQPTLVSLLSAAFIIIALKI